MRILVLLLIPLLAALAASAGAAPPRAEARALWVVRTALKSPAAVTRIVDLARKYHFNALIVQVRGRGDAYYCGGLEPRAEMLASQPADFDPLAQIIREAHAAGIQVHAWLNAFFLWEGEQPPRSPRHLFNAHPEWLLTDRAGRVLSGRTDELEGAYLDPAQPAARQWIHDVFLDVARRYDVDGIHFDYIRYPGPNTGFSDYDLAAFKSTVDPTLSPEEIRALDASPDRTAYPDLFPDRWAQWRRDNVTDLVRQVSQDVHALKPHVTVSAATIAWGPYDGWEQSAAWNRVSQDWFGWLRDGWLDLACPMAYHRDTESFAGWVAAAVANSHGHPIWAGIGAYLIPPESTAEKIEAARRLGAAGACLFSYDSITQDGASDAYLKRLCEMVYQDPASMPPVR